MVCGAAIVRKPPRRGTKPRIELAASGYWRREFEAGRLPDCYIRDQLTGSYEVCAGKIEVSIAAEDEPYFGGTDAVLALNYRCTVCHNTHFPELPSTYTLSEWLTERVRDLPEPEVVRAEIR